MKKIFLLSLVFLFGTVSAQSPSISNCSNTNPWGTVQCIPDEYWFNGACRSTSNCSGLKEADFNSCGCVCTAASRAATSPACDVDDPATGYVGTQTRTFSNSSCTYSCKTKSQTFLTKFDGSTSNNVESSVLFQDGSDLVLGGMSAANNDADIDGKDLKFDINGAIGADFYCDSDGDNCVSGLALGSSNGGLGDVCLNGFIKKTVSTDPGPDTIPGNSDDTYEWQCAADETGSGSLPTSCADGQVAVYDGSSWKCDNASGLSSGNGLDGANGLVGQNGFDGTGFSTDDNYCDDGEVLTWGVGALNDYNGDGSVNNNDDTNGDNVLDSSDRGWYCSSSSSGGGISLLSLDDTNVVTCNINQVLTWSDDMDGAGPGTVAGWICDDATSFWQKDINDNLSYINGNVGLGIANPGHNLEVDNEFFISESGIDYFHVDATGIGGLPEIVISGGTNTYIEGGGGVSINRNRCSNPADQSTIIDPSDPNYATYPFCFAILTPGLDIDAKGKIGAGDFCEESDANDCIDAQVLTSMNGTTNGTTECSAGATLEWNATDDEWNCIVQTAASITYDSTVAFSGISSYATANAACGQDKYVCTAQNIMDIMSKGDTLPTGNVMVHAGNPGYSLVGANDCEGWSNQASEYLNFTFFNGSFFQVGQCDMVAAIGLPLACCSY